MSQLSQGLWLFSVFSSVTRTVLSEVGRAGHLTVPAAACPRAGDKRATRSFPGAQHVQTSRALQHAGSKGGRGPGRAAEAEELSRAEQQPPGHGERARFELAHASLAVRHVLASSLLGSGGIGGCHRSPRCRCMGIAVPCEPSPHAGALCALARLSRGTSRSVLGCCEFSEIPDIPEVCGWRRKTGL